MSKRDNVGMEPKMHCEAITCVRPEWVEDIKTIYLEDPNVAKFLELIHSNTNPDPRYTLEGGIIRFHNRIYVGEQSNMRQQVMESLHQSAIGGHSRGRATYHMIKKLFF